MKATSRGYYHDQASGSWVIQAARTAPGGKQLRRCQRVRGTEAEARKTRQQMVAELDLEIQRLQQIHDREQQLQEAATLLGIDQTTKKKHGDKTPPTLREYLVARWADHVMVTQNATTRRTTRSHVGYLTYYLGQVPLDEIDEGAVAKIRESLLRDGPRSFATNKSGKPRQARATTFTPTSVNRIMATLAAALNLAERERTIDRAPHVDLLPKDQSAQMLPPTDDDLRAILKTARDFLEVAPLMPEAIELAAETGMRAGEQFALTWRSVDFAMGDSGAIRIEQQARTTLVSGEPWRPKHNKSRIIPLTPRAREILSDLRQRVPSSPSDRVIPSRGGSPYNRLEAAPDKAGKGFFVEVVEAAGTSRHVRWHDLRHYFAVRALLTGVPMAVVSSWLGHSDINLTVKQYGRWASEAREQWQWAKKMGSLADAPPPRPTLALIGAPTR